MGTYSPTDGVAQPLGVKGKNQSVDEYITTVKTLYT